MLVIICFKPILAAELNIFGWGATPSKDVTNPPPTWFGDDPILGRLACPALLRLEDDQGGPLGLKNTPLLLKDGPVVDQGSSGKERWTLTLRTGLKWWSGQPIEADHLMRWLKLELPAAAEDKLGIKNIDFNVSVAEPLTIKIEWSKAPRFGPFILAGRSFYNVDKNDKLECAGLYNLTTSRTSILHHKLTLNIGYKSKYSTINLWSGGATQSQGAILNFEMAARASHLVNNDNIVTSCKSKIDIPLVSAILWNRQSPVANTPSLRQAWTAAIPRGEILRTAAGDVGSLVSAPILRAHPGYHSKILVRPYNLEVASGLLDQAGYKQNHIGQPRMNGQNNRVVVKILRLSGTASLVEKMIIDSLASIGVETVFLDQVKPDEVIDGAIGSFYLPWPSGDLSSLGHSRKINVPSDRTRAVPFATPTDPQLDVLMDDFSVSLTHKVPDFKILHKIHQKWFDLEPWTLLMAHQYCLSSEGVGLPGRIDSLDGDWFRKYVLDN